MLKNNIEHILLIVFINLFYTVIINVYIQTDDVYYGFLLENYPKELATQIFNSSHSYGFIIYIISPLLIILRTLTFAVILDAILTCIDIYESGEISEKYTFNQFWKIFIYAEWSYVVFVILKFIWFGYIQIDYTYDELIGYSPFSLYSLIGNNSVDSWLIYPMKMFNLFELAYLITAIVACKKILKTSSFDSVYYISISYIIPFFIFIVFIMYINLHFMI